MRNKKSIIRRRVAYSVCVLLFRAFQCKRFVLKSHPGEGHSHLRKKVLKSNASHLILVIKHRRYQIPWLQWLRKKSTGKVTVLHRGVYAFLTHFNFLPSFFLKIMFANGFVVTELTVTQTFPVHIHISG